MDKKKKIKIWTIVALIICIPIAIVTISKNKVKNEVKPIVEDWVSRNHISIENYTVSKLGDDKYDITVYWNAFEKLSPQQMGRIVFNWDKDDKFGDTWYFHDGKYYVLEYIISNGHKYSTAYNDRIYSYVDSKTIFELKKNYSSGSSSYSSSSGNSSSGSSSKTATCNYCNGTGKVSGDKCPWCNGSGKTYDNYFNDLLG